jgi:hypothetical protein
MGRMDLKEYGSFESENDASTCVEYIVVQCWRFSINVVIDLLNSPGQFIEICVSWYSLSDFDNKPQQRVIANSHQPIIT